MKQIWVPGIPAPQGSKVVTKFGGLRDVSKNVGEWRSRVALACDDGGPPTREPIRMGCMFVFSRPRSHYGSGRNADKLRQSAPRQMTKRPDVDKLTRAVLDAMTGVVFHDDSQVVSILASKEFGGSPGARISWAELDPFAYPICPFCGSEAHPCPEHGDLEQVDGAA